MKFSLFSFFSVLCVQVALSASIGGTHTLELSNKESAVFLFRNEDNELVEPRINPLACIPAIRDVGSLAWQGYGLFREKREIIQKAKEGKENCNTVGGTPENLEKCYKVVDDQQKASEEALNKKVWALAPQVFTTLLALFKCLV